MKTMKVKGYSITWRTDRPAKESYVRTKEEREGGYIAVCGLNSRFCIDVTRPPWESLVWAKEEREGVYIAVGAPDEVRLHVDEEVYELVYKFMSAQEEHEFIKLIYDKYWNSKHIYF